MKKINVAKLLKDCPKGMELDCTAFNNVKFQCADNDGIWIEYIDSDNNNRVIYLTCYGGIKTKNIETKCIIFPKGKTTWEGFVPPCKFKDGDIVYVKSNKRNEYIIIFKEIKNDHIHKYVCFAYQHLSIDKCALCHLVDVEIMRLAIEEEKAKLFKAIKDNGYKWNEETKTLEDLIEPKFKVGDKIEKCGYRFTIKEVKGDYYLTKCCNKIPFDNQDDFILVPNKNKFDITTLKPFDKVLVRDCNEDKWNIDFFAYYREDRGDYQCMTFTKNQCVPYEGNEHLLGKNDDCDEYFNIWKK